jgi:hypothetical protein
MNHGALPAWAVSRGVERYGNSTIAHLAMSTMKSSGEAKRLGIVVDVFEPDELPPVEEIAARRQEQLHRQDFHQGSLIAMRRRNTRTPSASCRRSLPQVMQSAFARFRRRDRNVKNRPLAMTMTCSTIAMRSRCWDVPDIEGSRT